MLCVTLFSYGPSLLLLGPVWARRLQPPARLWRYEAHGHTVDTKVLPGAPTPFPCHRLIWKCMPLSPSTLATRHPSPPIPVGVSDGSSVRGLTDGPREGKPARSRIGFITRATRSRARCTPLLGPLAREDGGGLRSKFRLSPLPLELLNPDTPMSSPEPSELS